MNRRINPIIKKDNKAIVVNVDQRVFYLFVEDIR